MADETSPTSEGILPGTPRSQPASNNMEDAIAAGAPPPAARSENILADASLSIALPPKMERMCGKCGSLMAQVLCEDMFINGLIPSGQRLHYQCAGCGKRIMIRSPWRLFLLLFCSLFFLIMCWALFPFDDYWLLIFVLILAIYPLLLLSEFFVRMRYSKVGSWKWARRLAVLMVVAALAWAALAAARSIGPCLTTGDAALAAMSAEERAYYDRAFSQIEIGMEWREVTRLLGPNFEGLPLFKGTWHGPGHSAARESQIVVLLRNGCVTRARWYRRTGMFSGFYCRLGE